ncbi:MAG: hypothetical protein ACRENS_08545 [Candidatus Eiseniibacteriota bacterium]
MTSEGSRSGTMRITGAVLIVLGFAALIFRGIPYQSTENVAEFGTLKMKVTEKKHFEVPPLLSGCVILAGSALLFSNLRRPNA